MDGARRSTRCARSPHVIDFDPERRRRRAREEAQTGNAIDGDPGTTWSTESYSTPRVGWAQGRGRPHPRARPAGRSAARSSSTPRRTGWRAEVYVADGAGRRAGRTGASPSPRSTERQRHGPRRVRGRGWRGAAVVHPGGRQRQGRRSKKFASSADLLFAPSHPTADDRTLVAAAQAGDRGALDALLRRHHDRWWRAVPADGGRRRRRPGRPAGGADRHRPRHPPLRRARRPSPPGRTGSPPTPASTSCDGARRPSPARRLGARGAGDAARRPPARTRRGRRLAAAR